LTGAGALFNTVPRRVFRRGALSALPQGAKYVELASAPGGAAREDVVYCGGEYIAAPGLPGQYAPVSAGEALFRCIKGVLRERGML
ncbi:MAG: dipicolinate synthase subunit A, partial [Clostridia bacterium]|nr:dipicolinate synthase subunit A [Clostridia bacterium]